MAGSTLFVDFLLDDKCVIHIPVTEPGDGCSTESPLLKTGLGKKCMCTLKKRTVLPVEDITLLLEFCLKNTYFSFQGQFYEQVEGGAMGSQSALL